MAVHSPSEQQADVNKAAHLGRIAERTDRIQQLQNLLSEENKGTVLAALRESGYCFEDGFESKDLEGVRAAIQEVIGQMIAWNNENPGLLEAVRRGLAGNAAKPELSDVPNIQLSPEQAEYVREAIEADYERSLAVNRPLLVKKGMPEFPAKAEVLRAALSQLTPAQAEYMMEEGRVPFSFRVKLVAPNNRLDLVRTLLDGQPKQMSTESQQQQNLHTWERAERHLTGGNCGSKNVEWKWSFYQAEQVIDEVEAWDNTDLPIKERVAAFREQLPAGMKGTDRFDWATSMADGLEAGKPMDICFKGNATDTNSYEKWHFTLLDEEGEFAENDYRYLVSGYFYPDYRRRAHLYSYRADGQRDRARLRASVDGSIKF